MRRILGMFFAVAAVVGMTAGEARAQMTMSSFKGYLTGHVGAVTAGDVSEGNPAFGVSVSVQEGSGWGAELDVARTDDVEVAGTQVLDVNTYMVNAAWVRPLGRIRPFGVGGVGVMQVDGCAFCGREATTYDLGFTAGGGVHVILNDWAAVRGDARYIWTGADHPDLGRPANFKFWRLSAGFTFMWAVLP